MDQLKISPQSLVGSPNRELASVPNPASHDLATQRTALLFGCYRKAEANDPEVYTAAVAATLAEYSREVIEYVTDPRTGLPSKLKWLPTVAEVREACIEHARYLKVRDDVASRPSATISEPRKAPPMPPGLRSYAEATDNGRIRPIGRFEKVPANS